MCVCEGEARLLCRGEVDTSMVALCPLAQEAKGHITGINYNVRERLVYVRWGLRLLFQFSMRLCDLVQPRSGREPVTLPGLTVPVPLER